MGKTYDSIDDYLAFVRTMPYFPQGWWDDHVEAYYRSDVRELPDGRIASGSTDNTIKIWNFDTPDEPTTLTGHTGSVFSVAPLDGDRIVSGSSDQTVRIWEV